MSITKLDTTQVPAPTDESTRVSATHAAHNNDLSPIHVNTNQPVSTSPVRIRNGVADDKPIMRESFLKAYSDRTSWYGYRVNARVLKEKIDCLLRSPRWQLLVVCPTFEADEVMGMLLYRPATDQHDKLPVKPIVQLPKIPQVAWLTTAPKYRGTGVAKALIRHAKLDEWFDIDCVFMLPATIKHFRGRNVNLRFKPYIADCEMLEAMERGEV